MEREFKLSELVTKQAIKQTDSMILVDTERRLIAELYEKADFPRDFRTRIVHRESGLKDALLVEVFIDIIDASNPRVDYDPGWFKDRALPLGIAGQGPVTPEQQRIMDRWGMKDGPINDAIQTIYEPLIKKQLESRDQLIWDAIKGFSSPGYVLDELDTRQWAGGRFSQKVDEQTLMKLREDDIRAMEVQAFQMAHEAMRRQAMKDGVPGDRLGQIKCSHSVHNDEIRFQRNYSCNAAVFTWRGNDRPDNSFIKFTKFKGDGA